MPKNIPTMTKHLLTESDTVALATQLAGIIKAGTVLYLTGTLGAGKTTFARGFLRGLGYEGKVKSPTFTLVETYDLREHKIYHFDLYRIDDPKELQQIGIEEYFSADSMCLIEWPENGVPFLPGPDLACYISITGTGRDIRLEAHTPCGEMIIGQL